MGHSKQFSFFKVSSQHRFHHGGKLRKQRAGRGQRPLSSKEPLHLVFKARKYRLKHKSFRSYQTFALVQHIVRKYAKKFVIKIEEMSVQHDHLHLIIRSSRRSLFHYFFRVVAGQIAQRFESEGFLNPVTDTHTSSLERGTRLWIYRPFTRIVRSHAGYKIAIAYVRLNEKEVLKQIPYRKLRLKGLSVGEWQILWS